MTFSDRMKDLLDQGAQASKEFLNKAGAKAQDLGERGVLTLEIKQMESQGRKLLERLGNQVYRILAEENSESVAASDPAIKDILSDLGALKGAIEKREAELESRRKSAF
jgi:UDP:flavonoid glycosyltransferase YjiC (YdhE family)